MKRIMFASLAALLLALPGICPAAPAKDLRKVEIRKPVELNVRGGLPNFYQKLESGKPVKIAYFGGSITAQNGWRPQSLDYFRKLPCSHRRNRFRTRRVPARTGCAPA